MTNSRKSKTLYNLTQQYKDIAINLTPNCEVTVLEDGERKAKRNEKCK